MKTEFIIAVHTLVFLRHKGDWQTSEKIALNVCTNAACIRKVMAKLVKAGLVEKREGNKQGGYRFLQGKIITLREVADAAETNFVEVKYRSGDADNVCLIASGMAGYLSRLCEDLDERCRARLSEISIGDVEKELVLNKKKIGSVL